MTVEEAQSLYNLRDEVTEVAINLQEIGQEKVVAPALASALPGYEIDTWDTLRPEIRETLTTKLAFTSAIGLIVILVASIGILNIQLMAVFERTREMGVLAALGMKGRGIMGLFLLEGTIIGALGAVIGCVLGALLMTWIGSVGINFSFASSMGEMVALMGERLYPKVGAVDRHQPGNPGNLDRHAGLVLRRGRQPGNSRPRPSTMFDRKPLRRGRNRRADATIPVSQLTFASWEQPGGINRHSPRTARGRQTMAFGKLWTIAWRDLGRNRRRTFFSVLAVGMGLGLLILLNGYMRGVMEESLENSIRLETGHLQLRASTYEAEQSGILWEDLLTEPADLANAAMGLQDVEVAAPVLWASGYLNTRDESVGLRIFGIDPTSSIYAPFRRIWPAENSSHPMTAAVSSSASVWPTVWHSAPATRSIWP